VQQAQPWNGKQQLEFAPKQGCGRGSFHLSDCCKLVA